MHVHSLFIICASIKYLTNGPVLTTQYTIFTQSEYLRWREAGPPTAVRRGHETSAEPPPGHSLVV